MVMMRMRNKDAAQPVDIKLTNDMVGNLRIRRQLSEEAFFDGRSGHMAIKKYLVCTVIK